MPNEPNEPSGVAPKPELVQEISRNTSGNNLNYFRKLPDLFCAIFLNLFRE
jgi:hypothetical protein